jgi:hypothetical protein
VDQDELYIIWTPIKSETYLELNQAIEAIKSNLISSKLIKEFSKEI